MPEEFDDLPPVMTLAQVADVLQIQPQTVARHLADGSLRGFRVGRAWRITREALREFCEPESWTTDRNRKPAVFLAPEGTMLSTIQVAAILGRSRATAWRLMANGAIESRRQGREWVTTPEAVKQYLNSRSL